jgi:hypothetical protein
MRLYAMEDKLWRLPVLGRGVNFADGPGSNVIFANDTSFIISTELQGIGHFPNSISGVRVPTLRRHVEALILQVVHHTPTISACAWVAELAYMVDLLIWTGWLIQHSGRFALR